MTSDFDEDNIKKINDFDINKNFDDKDLTIKLNNIKIEEHIEQNRWKNRRKFAWISFVCIISCLIFLMSTVFLKIEISDKKIDFIYDICQLFLIIILTYISANAIEYINIRKKR